MFKKIKHIAKQSFVYSIGNVATKIIGVFLIPLYTNPEFFTQSDFGIIALLESSFQLLIGILGFSMANSFSRWYWEAEYRDKQKSIFFTCFCFLVFALSISLSSLFLNSENITLLLFKDTQYTVLIEYMLANAGIAILNNFSLSLIKLNSKSILFISVQLFKLLSSLSLTLLLIIHYNKGIEAIWIANLIADAAVFILLIPFVVKHSKVILEWTILKQMLKFGFPLMFASISSVLLSVTDKYMLNSMSGLENTALYSLGNRIANILKMVITLSIAPALAPMRLKMINDPNNHRFYSKILTYVGFVFIVAAVVISLFAYEIITLIAVNPNYIKAAPLVPIMSLTLFFSILASNSNIGLYIRKKTHIVGTIIFGTSLLNIALNITLIPIWDMYGAALSTMISQLSYFVILTHYSQKHYKIPYEWKKITVLTLLFIIISAVSIIIQPINMSLRVILKLSFIVLFPMVLYRLNFFESSEIETVKQIFKTWKNPHALKDNISRLLNKK